LETPLIKWRPKFIEVVGPSLDESPRQRVGKSFAVDGFSQWMRTAGHRNSAIPGARPGLHARPDAIFGVGCPWKTFIILASFCQMRSRWPDDVMGAALVRSAAVP
jgi:hypothetical protein